MVAMRKLSADNMMAAGRVATAAANAICRTLPSRAIRRMAM